MAIIFNDSPTPPLNNKNCTIAEKTDLRLVEESKIPGKRHG
jgi:hypothetical protein